MPSLFIFQIKTFYAIVQVCSYIVICQLKGEYVYCLKSCQNIIRVNNHLQIQPWSRMHAFSIKLQKNSKFLIGSISYLQSHFHKLIYIHIISINVEMSKFAKKDIYLVSATSPALSDQKLKCHKIKWK